MTTTSQRHKGTDRQTDSCCSIRR